NAGNPMLGFMKFDSNFANAQWAFTKSSDYGSTFSTDVHSSGYSGGNVCDCCPGTILNSGNTVAVLYRDAYNNIRDQWAAISTNSGATFPSGFTVDNTNWLLTSCPGSGPDGVIIGDTVITVYMSGASGTGMAYYSKSSISGAAIGSNQQMTGSFAGLTTQNYPRIANNGNAVAMTWKQAVSGVDQLGLLFTNNINNGFPPLYDTVAINNITNADVAIGNGVIHIVWEDDNAGVIRYRKGTFNTSITAVPTINGRRSASTIFPNPATDILTISNPDKIENIRIMDAIGNCVLTSKDNVISVKDLADGIYMIQIVTQNSIETKRLEKISK
ncbi:MAG: T9SS type A sorting domain-containing protein, partial [Bacteroidota bacterium]